MVEFYCYNSTTACLFRENKKKYECRNIDILAVFFFFFNIYVHRDQNYYDKPKSIKCEVCNTFYCVILYTSTTNNHIPSISSKWLERNKIGY